MTPSLARRAWSHDLRPRYLDRPSMSRHSPLSASDLAWVAKPRSSPLASPEQGAACARVPASPSSVLRVRARVPASAIRVLRVRARVPASPEQGAARARARVRPGGARVCGA
jgi:hypothetical protein